MKLQTFGAGLVGLLAVAGLGSTGFAGGTAEGAKAPAAVTNDFSKFCSKAWLKGVTAKDPSAYAVDEDIAFSISLEGVTNAVPQGLLRYKWKRTGSDGETAEGLAPVTKTPFVYTTKLTKPGAVRLFAEVIGKDGKPFFRPSGASKAPLHVACGALADPAQLQPREEPKNFVQFHKELLHRLGRPNFKKHPRTPVPFDAVKGVTVSRVELPSPSAHPLRGLLSVPAVTADGTKLPCRLRFRACGYEAEIPLPKPQDVLFQEILLTIAYDPGKDGARDEAFCSDLYLEVLRALQYLKSLPEWDGKGLVADGWGVDGLLSVWAAGSGEGVTELICGNVPLGDLGHFDPLQFARHIPSTCRVTIPRAGLGDAIYPPAAVVAFWNAMSCDRSLLWMQGAEGGSVPGNYSGRDIRWEKLKPVNFVRMDANHAKVEKGLPPAYPDVELSLRDKIVIEIVFDYTKDTLDISTLAQMKNYGKEAALPLEIYAVIPEKKVKDKLWAKFKEGLEKAGTAFPFPLYLNAGMDLPSPSLLPWFRLTDQEGVLRYSGNNLDALRKTYSGLTGKLPEPDPVFAYARPVLLTAFLAKSAKAKQVGPRLCKALELEMKKSARKDPARAAEARHLMIGMRQAVERRVQMLLTEFQQRPGRGYCNLQTLLAEWPDKAADARLINLRDRVAKHPEIEKLAKLEKELEHVLTWNPVKPAEMKKKTAAVDALRKKLEKMAKSPDVTTQGEVLLMSAELDNPPQPDGTG